MTEKKIYHTAIYLRLSKGDGDVDGVEKAESNSILNQRMIIDRYLGQHPDDIYMQTIKAAQFSEEDFFGTAINKDMMEILSSIRDAHMHDSTTADTTGADVVKNALDQANHFEGSAEEAQVAMFLKQLGIKYSKLTKDEFVTLMGILRKSDMLKSPGSKRGKGNRKKR